MVPPNSSGIAWDSITAIEKSVGKHILVDPAGLVAWLNDPTTVVSHLLNAHGASVEVFGDDIAFLQDLVQAVRLLEI